MPDDFASASATAHRADNGTLFAFGADAIPFLARHMFFISATNDSLRGRHAHRQTNQFLVVVSGEVEVSLDDGSGQQQKVALDVGDGLHVPPMVWASQKFIGENALLVVLTDAPYEESDYIRGYSEFVSVRRGTQQNSATMIPDEPLDPTGG